MRLLCVPGSEPGAFGGCRAGDPSGGPLPAPAAAAAALEAVEVGVGAGQSGASPCAPGCPSAPPPSSLSLSPQELLLSVGAARGSPGPAGGTDPRVQLRSHEVCLGPQEGQQSCSDPSCDPLSQCRPPSWADRSCSRSSPPLPMGMCPVPHLSPQAQSPWIVGDTSVLFQGGPGLSPGGGEPTNDTAHCETQLIFKNNNQN